MTRRGTHRWEACRVLSKKGVSTEIPSVAGFCNTITNVPHWVTSHKSREVWGILSKVIGKATRLVPYFFLIIGRAAYPTSQIPLRVCREPFPTSITQSRGYLSSSFPFFILIYYNKIFLENQQEFFLSVSWIYSTKTFSLFLLPSGNTICFRKPI